MMNNTILMKQLNQFYAVWQEYNYVYQEWAKNMVYRSTAS